VGAFYASSGVELGSIARDGDRLSIAIRPDAGIGYRTRFIGTRREAARADKIGIVLAEMGGTRATYRFRGDELYVRAKILSSKRKPNARREGEHEVAWVQPVVPPVAG
jgi:hypothetical protein